MPRRHFSVSLRRVSTMSNRAVAIVDSAGEDCTDFNLIPIKDLPYNFTTPEVLLRPTDIDDNLLKEADRDYFKGFALYHFSYQNQPYHFPTPEAKVLRRRRNSYKSKRPPKNTCPGFSLCKFKENGCKEVVLLKEIAHHELNCLYQGLPCQFTVPCKHILRLRDLYDHMIKDHSSEMLPVMPGNDLKVLVTIPYHEMSNNTFKKQFFFISNDIIYVLKAFQCYGLWLHVEYMAPPNAVLTASCFTDVEFNGEAPVGKMINIIKYHSRYPDEDNCLVLSVPKMEEGLSRSFTVSIYIHNHTKFIHIPKLL